MGNDVGRKAPHHVRSPTRRMWTLHCHGRMCSGHGTCTSGLLTPSEPGFVPGKCLCNNDGCECNENYGGDECEHKVSIIPAGETLGVEAEDLILEMSNGVGIGACQGNCVGSIDGEDYIAYGPFRFESPGDAKKIALRYSGGAGNTNYQYLEFKINSENGEIAGSLDPLPTRDGFDDFEWSQDIELDKDMIPSEPFYLFIHAHGGGGIMTLDKLRLRSD